MKGVVILSGKIVSKLFYDEYIKDVDFIICCDGGVNVVYKYGFVLNLIIGDFDFVDKEVLEFFKINGI